MTYSLGIKEDATRSKPYWKNPEELAKRSGHIRRPLSLLVEYAQKGWTMETVNPFGHKSVRFAMDSIFPGRPSAPSGAQPRPQGDVLMVKPTTLQAPWSDLAIKMGGACAPDPTGSGGK